MVGWFYEGGIKMLLKKCFIFSALVALSVHSPSFATQDAKKIAITPSSKNAAIIIKSANLSPPEGYSNAYQLNLEIFDPETKQTKGNFSGGYAKIVARNKYFMDGYFVTDLKPGTYVIWSFQTQNSWSLCYQNATYYFTINPGQVLYLGQFDAIKPLYELNNLAVIAGRTSSTGEEIQFFENVSEPIFLKPDEHELSAVRSVAKNLMMKTTVEPVAVELKPTQFETEKTISGKRYCSGYFQ
jgi:hypothetical protein